MPRSIRRCWPIWTGCSAGKVATVVRLSENAGHLAVWRHGILDRLGIDSEYVYTDPDVVPADSCPSDVIGMLQSVLADNERIAVAGLGLRLDDLPDSYRHKAQAIDWERQFWLAPAAPGLFLAPIDTTFALYRPGSGHCLGQPIDSHRLALRRSPSRLVRRRSPAVGRGSVLPADGRARDVELVDTRPAGVAGDGRARTGGPAALPDPGDATRCRAAGLRRGRRRRRDRAAFGVSGWCLRRGRALAPD